MEGESSLPQSQSPAILIPVPVSQRSAPLRAAAWRGTASFSRPRSKRV
jgi:hypothetical protein